MPADMSLIIKDLVAETEGLTGLVDGDSEETWSAATPAAGWSVRDQFTHLAFFDEAAVRAATDPVGFAEHRAEAVRDVDGVTGSVARRYQDLPGREVLDWFRSARAELVRVFAAVDLKARIPWYGPDMSPASAVTARLMETWAHGQDVFDALGRTHPAGPGLRHIAHIGVKTFANSFRVRGLEVPASEVSVELAAPDGDTWRWGPEDSPDRVRGPAVDFCLVVTQRRHLDDTSLMVEGPVARSWMSVAQAFAGPPGPGRPAGQFQREDGRRA